MDLLQFFQILALPKLKQDTRAYLKYARDRGRLNGSEQKLRVFAESNHSPQVSFGRGDSGSPIDVPLDAFCRHGLICGATGGGKSYCALSLMAQLTELSRSGAEVSFGLIDAKGELFQKLQQLTSLMDTDPDGVAVLDFSGSQPVPYSLLKPRQNEAPELLVERRMEVFSDVVGREGSLSLRMSRMLRYFLLLVLESENLSFPILEFLFANPEIVCRLAGNSKNSRVRSYFESDFSRERNTTLPALAQRMDFLLHNQALRLSFGANDFVDFQQLMDRGVPVVINCGGPGTPRSLSHIVQSLVLSDIRQAIFSRRNPKRRYVWFIDEAQCLFSQASDTENLVSIFSMARSYGTHLVLITQSLASAISDRGFYASLETNFGWIVLFRSGLEDAQVLAPGLPVTGKLVRKHYERGRLSYLSPEQEIRHRLREITSLPSRTAYFWLRGAGAKAVRMTSHRVTIPKKSTTRLLPSPVQAVDTSELRKHLEQQEGVLRRLLPASAPRKADKKKKDNVYDILTRLDRELDDREKR